MTVRAWPLLVGGGLAAYAWTRRGVTAAHPATLAGPLPGRWVWPVPRWNGRAPMISDGFNSPRPGVPRHGGVDIMFARLPADTLKAGSPNASKLFVMPDGLSAVAASDGVVRSAMQTPHGFAVVIDHAPNKVATFYTHLEKLLVSPAAPGKTNERVRAGQAIGIIGASPWTPSTSSICTSRSGSVVPAIGSIPVR